MGVVGLRGDIDLAAVGVTSSASAPTEGPTTTTGDVPRGTASLDIFSSSGIRIVPTIIIPSITLPSRGTISALVSTAIPISPSRNNHLAPDTSPPLRSSGLPCDDALFSVSTFGIGGGALCSLDPSHDMQGTTRYCIKTEGVTMRNCVVNQVTFGHESRVVR